MTTTIVNKIAGYWPVSGTAESWGLLGAKVGGELMGERVGRLEARTATMSAANTRSGIRP